MRPLRVYFTTSSKEGYATLSVDHTWSAESMTLALYPDNAVPEALPLLEPRVAHYVAQWEKYMVGDPRESDCVGFWLPSDTMPEHVAPPENWELLAEMNWRHTPAPIRKWLGDKRPDAVCTWDPSLLGHGNIDDLVVEPDRLGIEMYGS